MIDLTGQKFGRLKILRQAGKDKRGNYKWLCLCDCRNKIIVPSDSLRRDNTRSCGCLRKEKTVQRSTKHGHKKNGKVTGIYRSWRDMKNRCINPNNKQYKDYGGRGIKICKQWRNSFSNFLEDIGECPPGYTIERIKNDKGYYPGNCKWATRKEQNRNSRNNRYETHEGKTQCVAEWAEETGILQSTIRARIRLGWSTEKALTTSVKKRKK